MKRLSRNLHICYYAISPDRQSLAWAVAKRAEHPSSQQALVDLMVYDFATDKSRLLVKEAPLADYPDVMLSWAPKGDMIAYRTGRFGENDEVFVVPVDGSPPHRIADGPPDWPVGSAPALGTCGALCVLRARRSTVACCHGRWRCVPFAKALGRQLQAIEGKPGQFWSMDEGLTGMFFTVSVATKRAGLARVNLVSGTVTSFSRRTSIMVAISIPHRHARWEGCCLRGRGPSSSTESLAYSVGCPTHPDGRLAMSRLRF